MEVGGDGRVRHLVKRYGGTRLYDATVPGYVEVGQLRALVRRGIEVVVVDAATGEDVSAGIVGTAP